MGKRGPKPIHGERMIHVGFRIPAEVYAFYRQRSNASAHMRLALEEYARRGSTLDTV